MQYLFFISILPVILLLTFVYKKDNKKEPKKLLSKAFWFGFLSAIPVLIIELLFIFFVPKNIFGYHLLSNFIGIALVEEGFKWLVVSGIYKKDDFDETFDGIVYSVFASLGFAAIENIIFVCSRGMGTGVLRALTAVPGHAYYAVIMGYFFGKAKRNRIDGNSSKETKYLLISLLLPVLLHGIYDSLLVPYILPLLIWFVFVVFISVYSIILVFKAAKNNERYIKNKFCINCGNEIDGSNYCDKCGKKNE